MINEKMYRLGSERSEIRELFEYGKKRKAEIGEENVYDFSLGNPSIPCPDEVNAVLIRLLKEESSVRLHGYTSAEGDKEARASIARKIRESHGFDAEGDLIFLTAGAAASLTCTLCALANVGEEVILLAPYFPEYRVFTERAGATVKEVKCNGDSFEPDAEAIERAINERTAAIVVNSPNNPTGAVYDEETIIRITELLKRKSREYGRPIYLIADEPYRELVFDGAEAPYIPNYYEDTVVCYSYSKSLSLPGERIGYAMVSPKAKDAKAVYAAIVGAGRSLGYVCAPSLMQKALPELIDLKTDMTVYDANRRLLLTELTKYGYTVVNPRGAFYLFVKAPTGNGRSFAQMAKRHDLIIVPSESFGYEGYVRISYCVDTDMIKRALPTFKKLAKETEISGE